MSDIGDFFHDGWDFGCREEGIAPALFPTIDDRKTGRQGKNRPCHSSGYLPEKKLDRRYLDHPLKGEWKKYRECHIENDWLPIYRVSEEERKIYFEKLGSHSELFK